jgi:alkenylglycerophosphocholine/alkenylglycerophosphoethanolamine hydrolase
MNEVAGPQARTTIITWVIAAVGVAAGIIFILTGEDDNFWLHLISKPVPVLMMALWLFLGPVKGRYQWAVIGGLLLSATGDVLLSWSDDTFLFGLIAFLLGHVAYIIAFLQDSRGLYPGRALLVYAYGALAYGYLATAGDLGAMAIPVLAYMIVICTMLWRAAGRLGAADVLPRSAWAGFLGAAFFVLSDTLLALGMFAGQRPLGPHAVILTYWVGQLGIMLSAAWQRNEWPVSGEQPAGEQVHHA